MENKICIYAICKNESAFVEQWLESMKEADYIVILDTGSTDNTFELLKDDPRVYRAEQKVFNPWRFDVARNASMELIPEDANILICTDLDEVFEPGWAQPFRDNWKEDTARGWYKYAWSHADDGTPGRIFYYDKAHDRNWHWEHPVHEMLVPNDPEKYNDAYVKSHVCNIFDQVYLHHYPDKNKSRGSYLPLLELRVQESPDDFNGRIYLAHEYCYRGLYDKSIEAFNKLIPDMLEARFGNLEVASCYIFLGDCYTSKEQYFEAMTHYMKAIDYEPTYREPYMYLAQILNMLGMHHAAIGTVKEGLRNSYRHYSWLERDNSWNEQPYDILSVAYFYIGEKDLAYMYSLRAHEINPNDERVNNNLEIIKANL